MTDAVVARGLVKTFATPAEEVHVLRGADLLAAPGTLTCLFGASGSGKTTLISILAGLLTADGGSVELLGADCTTLKDAEYAHLRLTRIGVVFQDHNLIMQFTAKENIALPLVAQGLGPAEADTEAMRCLELVSLGELANRMPAEMSGGQRQRVGVARAIAGHKSLLLADEPTGSLDQTTTRALFATLRSLAGEHGITVLLGTHDPGAADVADQSFDLADGRLVPHVAH